MFAQPAGDWVNPWHAMRTRDVETEGSEAESHPRLHSKSEESLGYETAV